MATSLQTLINKIPRAEDGHIITRQYHNSLLEAIEELARQVGTGTGSSESDTSVTYAPAFLPITEAGTKSPEWVLSLGVSSRAPNTNSTKGWFPIQVPDNARIKSMTVTGQRSNSVLSCQVRLMRQRIGDATVVPMIIVNLKNLTGSFKQTAEVSGASLPIIQDFQAVNNDRYQYLVLAELTLASSTSEAIVDLYAIQIEFGESSRKNNTGSIANVGGNLIVNE